MLLTTVSIAHIYIYRRFVRDVWETGHARKLGKFAIVGLAVMLLAGIPLGRFLGGTTGTVFAYIAFGYFGLLAVLLPLLISLDLLKGGYVLWARTRREEPDEERRRFLSRGVAAATVLGASSAGAVGMNVALDAPELRTVEVPIKDLPEGLKGFKIVQLTDVHIGSILQKEFLEAIVARVNALNPDAVVITGDLVDGTVARLKEHVAPLAQLKSTHGSFFVTGNHEYYSGADAWLEYLTSIGIRALRNEHVAISHEGASFDLLGVDDWRAKAFGGDHGYDIDRAVQGRDRSRVSVLLSHQPKAIHDAAKHEIDLVLSGHTHGGQIFPFNLAVQLVQPYVSGLHQHSDRTWIYVSTGTGFWGPPVRVGTRSEISEILLVGAGRDSA